MILLYSKTYDYTTSLVPNYFLSQFTYVNQSKNTIDILPVFYLTLKRKKNKVFSNMATALSILLLLFGFMPSVFVNPHKLTGVYQLTWYNKKIFYNLDLFFFLLLPKLKKSKELVQLQQSNNMFEISFFNLLNVYLIKTLDTDTNLIANINMLAKLSSDVTSTRKIKFFQKALQV